MEAQQHFEELLRRFEVPLLQYAKRIIGNSERARDVVQETFIKFQSNGAVAPALQDRVREIAQNLGYIPHAAARALASQRSKIIGAVIPSLENQNFALGVFALQKRIGEAGYTLLLACSYYDQEDELKQVRALIADGIAGLMLVGRSHSPALYELLEKERIPLVNGWTVDQHHPYVGFDNVVMANKVDSDVGRKFKFCMTGVSDAHVHSQ